MFYYVWSVFSFILLTLVLILVFTDEANAQHKVTVEAGGIVGLFTSKELTDSMMFSFANLDKCEKVGKEWTKLNTTNRYKCVDISN